MERAVQRPLAIPSCNSPIVISSSSGVTVAEEVCATAVSGFASASAEPSAASSRKCLRLTPPPPFSFCMRAMIPGSTRRRSRRRRLELEVDGEVEEDVDRLSVESGRFEGPLLHGVNRRLVETERQRLEDPDILHRAVTTDERFDDDDPADARLESNFWIHRLDSIDDRRRSYVASHAEHAVRQFVDRLLWLGRPYRFDRVDDVLTLHDFDARSQLRSLGDANANLHVADVGFR